MIGSHTEVIAIVLTVVVHVIGAGALIWGMVDHDDPDRGSWRDWWPRDDRPDDDGPPAEPDPRPAGGLVIPVLEQSRPAPGRVREGGRIGDRVPRPDRRPAHPGVPERAPQRTPTP